MPFRRVLADATSLCLNTSAKPKKVKQAYFRKARWEQAPDASELPDSRLIDFSLSQPENEKPNSREGFSHAFNDGPADTTPAAIEGAEGAKTTANTTLGSVNHLERLGSITDVTVTSAGTANDVASPHAKTGVPYIDADLFIHAAVAYGLGAWNQPDLVNRLCSLIRYDVKSMLNRLLPKPDDTIICLALYYITQLFGERPFVSVLATGWGDTLAPLRIIRLGLTLAYKWHEDHPASYHCPLCHLEVCDCVEWNGGEPRGKVVPCLKDKNNVIKEIWKPTECHPLLPRYALARMEKEAMVRLGYDLCVDMGEFEWVRFLSRFRDRCTVKAGVDGVSAEDYRLSRLAIFRLVQSTLGVRFKKVKT